MTGAVHAADIERFRAVLSRHLGLQFDDARCGFLGEVLLRRLDQVKAPAATYLSGLDLNFAADERAILAREVTVGETYFFRNSEQFHALTDIVLPDRLRANAATRMLRLLSAGCASGEEAYSIAIALRETGAATGWNTSVRAVDVNPAALQKAAEARYSTWALRETPAETQRRWFKAAGRDLILDPTIRDAVHFDERNLAAEDGELWQPCSFDVVFCRNVLMYFTLEQARAVMTRIARALMPGGYLFLGHAETLRGLSDDFHLLHTHGTFYYQRKGEPREAAPPIWPHVATVAAADPIPTANDAWVDMIRGASERIAALTTVSAKASPPGTRSPAPDLVGVLALLRRERFAEALELLRTVSSATPQDPDVLLLEATLLTNSGLLPAAEETCRRLLAIDDLNAGAHYILALCRESAGDVAGAAKHDQVAAYLDPGFAMPRLHLGLLARRAGDRTAGQRELAQALVLLRREDPSRLLLFGGGFDRGSLLALCQSALADCGGEP